MAYLNRNILFLLFTGLFIASAHTAPYKDLNIDFLLEDSTKAPVKKQVIRKIKGKKSFSNVVKDLLKIEGLFTLFWNEKTNQAHILLHCAT